MCFTRASIAGRPATPITVAIIAAVSSTVAPRRPRGVTQRLATASRQPIHSTSGSAPVSALWRNAQAKASASSAAIRQPRCGARRSWASSASAQAKPASVHRSFHTCGSSASSGGHRPSPSTIAARTPGRSGSAAANIASADHSSAACSANMPPGPGTTRSLSCQIIAISGGCTLSNAS